MKGIFVGKKEKVMPKETFEVPEEIKKFVEEKERAAEEKRKAKEEKQKSPEWQKLMARKRQLQKERRRKAQEEAKRRLAYAKKIFKWAREFEKSQIGKQLIAMSPRPLFGVLIIDDKPEGAKMRWIGVGTGGVWWQAYGCGAQEQYVASAEELAHDLELETLKLACQRIDNGQVWESVKQSVGRRPR